MADLYCDDAVEGLLEPSGAGVGTETAGETAPAREFPSYHTRDDESEEEEPVVEEDPTPVAEPTPPVAPEAATASTRIAICEDSDSEGDLPDDAFVEEVEGGSDAEDLEALD